MREIQKSVYSYTARMALLDFTIGQLQKDEQQLLEDFPVGRTNLRRLTGNKWTPDLHAVKKAEPVPEKNEVFRLVDPAGNFCEHPYRTEHP